MDEKKFFQILSEVYKKSSEFWENDFPDELDKNLHLTGPNSLLSSLELVTFIAELESELLKYGINISFLDEFIELDGEIICIENLFRYVNKI